MQCTPVFAGLGTNQWASAPEWPSAPPRPSRTSFAPSSKNRTPSYSNTARAAESHHSSNGCDLHDGPLPAFTPTKSYRPPFTTSTSRHPLSQSRMLSHAASNLLSPFGHYRGAGKAVLACVRVSVTQQRLLHGNVDSFGARPDAGGVRPCGPRGPRRGGRRRSGDAVFWNVTFSAAAPSWSSWALVILSGLIFFMVFVSVRDAFQFPSAGGQ